jgi:thiol-disulfide isomerase/thioredoxin
MNKRITYKLVLPVLFALLGNSLFGQCKDFANGQDLVKKVYDKLNSLKNIQYHHSRIVDVKSELIYSKYDGEMKMLFTPKSKIGVFYLFEDTNGGITTYDGKAEYNQFKKEDRAERDTIVSINDFNSKSFLNPSINTVRVNFEWLRNTADYLITSADTIIETKKYSNIYFQIKGNTISANEGKLEKLEGDIVFYYTIVVDAKTYLPYKIIRKYSLNAEDAIATTFTNIEIDKNIISENIFTPTNINLAKTKIEKVSVKNNNWTLPMLHADTSVSKTFLKGNVVMLEFFFVGCSPCKKAMPWLASLKEKYKGKAFKFYSVNPIDSKGLIEKYKRQNTIINYDILYNTNSLSKDYDVNYYPKVVLLNKNGDIIYNGPLIKNVIVKLIKENL